MLSKVAERVYWTARYLERVESTARLISIYDQLLFDLPKNVHLSWYNLIIINSLEYDFQERYSVQDERNVIKFLVGDESNPCSIVSSLKAARENVRTTRDVIPNEIWELTNELSLYIQENLQQGINRSQRQEFLEEIVTACQQIIGVLYGNMPHDAVWCFWRLGRNLERADMTSRNLDAGMAAILELEEDETAVNSRQIIWGNVLRSLNADQSYRRIMRSAVNGKTVVQYLIGNKDFPRSITYCFNSLDDATSQLPNSKKLLAELSTIQKNLFKETNDNTLGNPLRDYLNNLQIQLQNIHQQISKTWFPSDL